MSYCYFCVEKSSSFKFHINFKKQLNQCFASSFIFFFFELLPQKKAKHSKLVWGFVFSFFL